MKHHCIMDLHGCTLFLTFVVSYLPRYSCEFRSHHIKTCPTTTNSRKQRSDMLNCTWEMDVNTYHCILTDENRLTEFCFDAIGMSPKDGCPYITKVGERITIQQKECTGNITGCPEAITDVQFLSSELYKFPSCLSFPVKRTRTKEPATKTNIIYDFNEVTESRTSTHVDSSTTNGNIADMEVLFLTYQIILFGVGLYVLICVLTGYIAFNLYKRIKELRVRLEADIYIFEDPIDASMTQPQHDSGNEVTYNSVYDEVEGSES